MTHHNKVAITQLPAGVPGLDAVLGGGVPEYSLNLIAGQPGTGKTTLAHQFAFANATAERRALIFTILGEPTVKMLRYQQQFSYFDAAKVGDSVRFVNLTDDMIERGVDGVLERIVKEVEESGAGIRRARHCARCRRRSHATGRRSSATYLPSRRSDRGTAARAGARAGRTPPRR